jgi:hypothetical protein
MPASKQRRLLGSVMAMCLAAMLTLLTGVAWAGPNPPGNNGTVKIDDTPFDDHPNNEPHVGCPFEVDFYGFDEGPLFADVTFEAHPPTGPVQVLETDTVFIGQDDNRGGGSEAGLDASAEYTLDTSGIEPHPKQGVHVKLTVNADGSQGADTKHKVFWVTGCQSSSTSSSTTTTPTTPPSNGDTSSTTSSTTTTPPSSGDTSSTTTTPPSSGVRGETSTTALGAGPGLPFTGGNVLPLLLAGLGLVGAGAATILAMRRRQAQQ